MPGGPGHAFFNLTGIVVLELDGLIGLILRKSLLCYQELLIFLKQISGEYG